MPKNPTLPSTDAQKVSAIKRINERLADLGRKLGQDTSAYKDLEQSILSAIPLEFINISESGKVSISHGKKAVKAISSNYLLELQKKPTSGDVIKNVTRNIKQEISEGNDLPFTLPKRGKIGLKEVKAYIKIVDEIKRQQEEDYDLFYNAIAGYYTANPLGVEKPTYTDISRRMEEENRQRMKEGRNTTRYKKNLENLQRSRQAISWGSNL